MLRVVTILMLLASGSLSAQNDNNQKDQSEEETRRPSWSSGLPERQKTDSLQRPGLRDELKKDMTIERSELGLERPKVEYSMPEETTDSSDVIEQTEQNEQQVIEQDVIEPVIEDTTNVQEPVIAVESEQEPEPEVEPATYEWVVINQAEVDFPPRGVQNQINGWVDVEVTLNPQGDVVSARTVDFSDEAGIYVEAAESSLNKWVFQPPEEQGVSNLVSKVYRVDFVPPALEESVEITSNGSDNTDVAEQFNDVVDKSSENYQWQILNQVPLDYPIEAARKRLEGWVDIIVTINPDGDVIELKESNHSQRGRVFVEPAKSSIVQWQFDPPKNQGINENVSRSYRIEFEL